MPWFCFNVFIYLFNVCIPAALVTNTYRCLNRCMFSVEKSPIHYTIISNENKNPMKSARWFFWTYYSKSAAFKYNPTLTQSLAHYMREDTVLLWPRWWVSLFLSFFKLLLTEPNILHKRAHWACILSDIFQIICKNKTSCKNN